LGIAFTRTTTRELWSVTDIGARVITEEVNYFDPACSQPVGDNGPVTGLRVALKTKHTEWSPPHALFENIKGGLRNVTSEVCSVDAMELIKSTGPRCFPAWLRVPELDKMGIGDALSLQAAPKRVFREALFT
jgi:hypothetical protein